MRLTPVLCLILLGIRLGLAQMSLDQKRSDFQQLAGLFSKRYAFTEWKKQAIHFDSLNMAPWLSRINSRQDDLDFFEICMEYVAANQDAHTAFELPSSFAAILNFKSAGYPTSPNIENIGVLPDKVSDYMTKDNLLQQGKPFVTGFTQVMVDYIHSRSKQ